MMMMKTNLAIVLVMLAVLTRNQVLAAAAPAAHDTYGETGDYGGDGSYGGYGEGSYGGYGEGSSGGYGEGSYGGYGEGSYGGYGGYGWHGRKWNDVEMFLSMRDKLIQAATNAVGFSQLAALNQFNFEALGFPYSFPGKLSLYVRELEKVPPYYKYDYLYKKTSRSDDDDMN